jgi:hypothetical protein
MKLYYHKTDGGAIYLTDTFIKYKDGSKEGVFKGAKYIVRIDGDITEDAELDINEEQNNTIYLIKYIADDTIEGYVQKEKDFEEWLKEHNKRRKEEGESKESKFEFELIKVNKITKYD